MATPEAPQYIGQAVSARPRLLRLLDERDAAGGRAKAALFLLHPGPSLLVTAVTVGAAAIALRAAPPPSLALRLALLMLPAQLAIGAANDLADARADRVAKPHKPLARDAVSVGFAWAVVAVCVVISLGTAATFGPPVLGATAVGLGAGLAYDAGLKRGPLSWLPWWVAFTALPICADTAAGRFTRTLWWTVPLTAVLALSLHCANALPDLAGDRATGTTSLPARLGERRTRTIAVSGMLVTAALTAALARPLHQSGPWLPIAWACVAVSAFAATTVPAVRRAPFPALALAAAALAIAWLAALPAVAALAP
jgi:4-hydroxybenzoate polyprenyltransferase